MSRPSRVSTYEPAVQTYAGLYSGFTPSVAALDRPSPKTFSEAQKTASNVLWGAPPSGPGVHKARDHYMRQYYNSLGKNVAWDMFSGSSTTSIEPSYYSGSYNTSYNSSYAHPSLYSSTGSSKTFHTCGNLGGEQHIRTGGAVGGETIAQTGGGLGGGSVSKTGGSLGEALGLST